MSKAEHLWNLSNLRKAYLYLQKNSMKDTGYRIAERIADRKRPIYTKKTLSEAEIETQQKQAEKLKQESSVCFSVLVPAYETRPEYLQALLESLAGQTYPFWELVLADASETDGVKRTVEQFIELQPQCREQIRYVRLAENKGISGNSNEALPFLTGTYTGLLDHDDTLSPDALYEMARAVKKVQKDGREAIVLYSDEDKMNEDGTKYYEPHYKEKFNFDLILSNNYICHFLVLQTKVLQELGFRSAYDGAQDYDLTLRSIHTAAKRQNGPAEIVHVDKILYHWRCHAGSTADNPTSKMYAYEAGRKAVSDYCKEKGMKVFVHHEKHLGFYRVEYQRDIFRIRQDIGAVGGRLLRKGKLYAGAYRMDGTVLYAGLNRHFSGYMHRAILQQDVDAVDIRCIRLREAALPMFYETLREILGKNHALTRAAERIDEKGAKEGAVSETVLAAWKSGGLSEEQIRQISLTLGQRIRRAGYLVLWNPAMEIDIR